MPMTLNDLEGQYVCLEILIRYVYTSHMNLTAHVAYDFNCLFETEGLL